MKVNILTNLVPKPFNSKTQVAMVVVWEHGLKLGEHKKRGEK